jgi:hypothetical protein
VKTSKKLIAVIIAIALVGVSNSNMAYADTKYGQLDGHDVIAHSSITGGDGVAYTDLLWSGSVSVSATYIYVNINTLDASSYSNSSGGQSSCQVSFTAPNNCRSAYISANHTASLAGQSWSASTSDPPASFMR